MSQTENTKPGHIDWFILLPVVGLMLFSVAFVYSASASFSANTFGASEKLFISHAVKVIFGLIILIAFAKIDYHIWAKISKPVLILSIGLLFVVLLVGTSMKGASRWISLGPISFQPSELVKFALVLHFAKMLNDKQDRIKDFQSGFLPFMFWTAIVCVLIALQPNFSTMMIIFILSMSIMFIGNVNILHLLAVAGSGLGISAIYFITAPYRMNRLLTFLGLKEGGAADQVSYQLKQALIAIGNGGVFGVGPGQSRQSHFFLPESYGDFIFSIIGEEYGLLGLTVILAAFVLIIWRGMIIAKNSPDNFGYFLAIGILLSIAFYVFVNAGVNTGLLPTTGVPMPFISYGGTAIFMYSAAVGILLNISAHAGVYPKVK